MDRKIKTRQVHKDIKVLDKTVTVTDHIKQSYVRTKENVMQSTERPNDRENNPVGYAEDAASEYADRIFHKTGHQVRRQAGKIIERKKEKASVSSTGEETVYQPKEQIRPVPSSGEEKAQEQGKELAVKKIKTIERDKRTIKTGRASEQVVKNTGKGTIKTSGKAVKTAEQTARTSIKIIGADSKCFCPGNALFHEKGRKSNADSKTDSTGYHDCSEKDSKSGNTCDKSVD